MNDDKFLDEALKEHARHEGKADQEFLDQLEANLDEQEDSQIRTAKKSQGIVGWMSAAALVLIGVTAGAIYLSNRPSESALALHEESEAPTVLNSDVAPLASSESKTRSKLAPKLDEAVIAEREAILSLPASAPVDSLSVTTSPTLAKKPTEPAGPTVSNFGLVGSSDASSEFGDIADGLHPGRVRGGDLWNHLTEAPSGNKYGALIEQGFLSPLKAPLSTFSTDVDTASYTNVRKLIETGQQIDPDAVRIEEMINYFSYQYEQSLGDHPFAVHPEVASCPWNPEHRLVRIGIKGKDIQAEARKASNLVFLIDVSGSMNSPGKLPLLVQSFEVLLAQLNDNDRVSLVVYAGRQAVLLNPTAIDQDGRAAVSNALQQLSAGGSTNGAAGISTAYDLARKGFIEGGVNRVILATDGDFNVGTTNQEELLKLVKNQAEGKISLTVLGFGQGNLNDALMEELTNRGDGNYFYLDSLREGQKVFQDGLTGTLQTIAKDVKIQVEFNPGKVSQYRLIGYANRRLKDEDFANDKIDAGDIGAGHTVTALYEIIPAGVAASPLPSDLKYQKSAEIETPREIVSSPELLTIKLRYKQPDGETSTELSQALTDENRNWQQASDDFRFASSVALWGMLLRNSDYAAAGTPEMVTELALGGRGNDPKSERASHLDLLRIWNSRR